MIWKDGVEDPGSELLKLTPWRIELYGLGNMATLEPPRSGGRSRLGITAPANNASYSTTADAAAHPIRSRGENLRLTFS